MKTGTHVVISVTKPILPSLYPYKISKNRMLNYSGRLALDCPPAEIK
jgi:hypothetical protein